VQRVYLGTGDMAGAIRRRGEKAVSHA
jgi:hypothetical protein